MSWKAKPATTPITPSEVIIPFVDILYTSKIAKIQNISIKYLSILLIKPHNVFERLTSILEILSLNTFFTDLLNKKYTINPIKIITIG